MDNQQLGKLKLPELREEAKKLKIAGISKLKKQELIEMIAERLGSAEEKPKPKASGGTAAENQSQPAAEAESETAESCGDAQNRRGRAQQRMRTVAAEKQQSTVTR